MKLKIYTIIDDEYDTIVKILYTIIKILYIVRYDILVSLT